MCLKAITVTLRLESDNKRMVSHRIFFSCLVRDQNLLSQPILHLKQPRNLQKAFSQLSVGFSMRLETISRSIAQSRAFRPALLRCSDLLRSSNELMMNPDINCEA